MCPDWLVQALDQLWLKKVFYLPEERPGAYIMVGNHDGATVHHLEYDLNDNAIPAPCSWCVGIVELMMPLIR